MVAIPNDQPSKLVSSQPVEPPPTYSPHVDPGSTASPFKTKPTNFLSLSASNNAIRGEFVIDPSLQVPSSVLPPLNDGETEDDRKNLSLAVKHNSIHAEIRLLPSGDTKRSRRTTIALTSENGAVHAQLHTCDGAAPFSVTSRSVNGSVYLALPRSFQGLLMLSTRHGRVSVSDALVRRATQLSQLGDTQRYFVGDFAALGEGEWEGDRAEAEAVHGFLRVKYVDEEAQGWSGLFGRFFGS